MENSLLQFILSKENERKKIIYILLSLILSIIISCKIYWHFIEHFDIISLSEYTRIVRDFFLSGRFIICLFILIVIHKFFYSFSEFLLYMWFAKLSDKLYEFLKRKKDELKNEFLEDLKTNKKLQWFFMLGFNAFKRLNVIEYENNKLTLGVNFYEILKSLRRLNSGDEDEAIDTSMAYFLLPITFQLLLLFNTVVIRNHHFSLWTILVIDLLMLLLCLIQAFIYFINIFIELKKHKLLSYFERLEKRVAAQAANDTPKG